MNTNTSVLPCHFQNPHVVSFEISLRDLYLTSLLQYSALAINHSCLLWQLNFHLFAKLLVNF
jgi:hypothetical protein